MADISDKQLKIILTANSAVLRKDLDKAQRKIKKLDGQIKKTSKSGAKSFGVLGAGASKGLGKMLGPMAAASAAVLLLNRRMARIKESLSFADDIAKTADSIGLTTDQLQELRHGAEIAGIEVTAFDKAFKRFTVSIGEADSGLSTAVRSFDDAGVSIYDLNGQLKNNHDLFLEFAEGITHVSSTAKKAEIAKNLLGARGGIAMLNFFKEGKAGIIAMAEEAHRLGIVLGEDYARAAEGITDELTRIEKAQKRIAAETDIASSGMVLAWAKVTSSIEKATAGLGVFLGLWDSPQSLQNEVDKLIKDRSELSGYIVNTRGKGKGRGKFNNAEDDLARLDERLNQIKANPLAGEKVRNQIDGRYGGGRVPDQIGPIPVVVKNPTAGAGTAAVSAAAATKKPYMMGLGFSDQEMLNRYEGHGLGKAMEARQAKEAEQKLLDEEKAKTFQELREKQEQEMQRMKDTADGWRPVADSFIDSLEGIKNGTQTAEQAITNFIFSLIQESLRARSGGGGTDYVGKILGGIGSFLNGSGGADQGYVDGNGFIGARAGGGAARAGQPYMVGEHDRELFIPESHGRIVPNKDLKGGGSVTVVQNFATPPSDAAARRLNRMAFLSGQAAIS